MPSTRKSIAARRQEELPQNVDNSVEQDNPDAVTLVTEHAKKEKKKKRRKNYAFPDKKCTRFSKQMNRKKLIL